MLLVKTRIGPSSIHGTGLFADEFIPKGAVIWRFIEGLDIDIPQSQYDDLPIHAQRYLQTHGFYDSGRWIMSGDHGQFINHSTNANTITGRGRDDLTATVNIQIGEEITEDYKSFDFGGCGSFITYNVMVGISAPETKPA